MDSGTIAIGIGLVLGLAGLGVGVGQGIAVLGATSAMARQPEIRGDIRGSLLVGLAFMEFIALLAVVLGFVMLGKMTSAPSGAAMLQTPSHQSVALSGTVKSPALNQ